MPVLLVVVDGDRWITGDYWSVNLAELVNSRFGGALLRKNYPPLTSVFPCVHSCELHTHTQKHTMKCLCAVYFVFVCLCICISLYILHIVYLCKLDFSAEGRACSVIALGLIVLAWLPPLPSSFFPNAHKIFLPFISRFSSAAPGECSMSPGLVSRLNPALRGSLSFYLPLWVWVCKNQSNISTICLD